MVLSATRSSQDLSIEVRFPRYYYWVLYSKYIGLKISIVRLRAICAKLELLYKIKSNMCKISIVMQD